MRLRHCVIDFSETTINDLYEPGLECRESR
jgi:hypothetical protein